MSRLLSTTIRKHIKLFGNNYLIFNPVKNNLRKYILIGLLFLSCIGARGAYNDQSNFIVPSDGRILTTQALASWTIDGNWYNAQVYFGNTGFFSNPTYTYYVTRGNVYDFWRQESGIDWNFEQTLSGSSLGTTPNSGGFSVKRLSIPANASLADGANLYVGKISSWRKPGMTHWSKDRYVYFNIYLVRLKYRLVYNANGGTGTVPATWTSDWTDGGIEYTSLYRVDQTYGIWDYNDEYKFSTTHALDNNPSLTKAGYSFSGWSYKANGDVISGNATISGTGSLNTYYNKADNPVTTTVYALWTPKPFTAYFNANGGSVSTASAGYTVETTFTLPTPLPPGAGYKFAGWKVTSVGTDSKGWTVGAIYPAGASAVGNYGDVTFEAQWVDQYKYTVVYDYNGGTKNGNSSVKEGTEWCDQTSYSIPYSHLYDKTIYPAKTNRVMSGWYTAPSGGAAAFVNEVKLTGVKHEEVITTIYAQWCNNINASIDHGTVEPSSQSVKEWQISTPVVFTPSLGYQITGITKKVGSGSAAVISGVTFPASGYTYPSAGIPDGEVTLVATAVPIQYKVNLNPDGGTTDQPQILYDITSAISLPTPEKGVAIFNGWKVTTADGNWEKDKVYTNLTIPAGMYGNPTLTALWSYDTYTITFDGADGPVTPEAITYMSTDEITLPRLDDSLWKYHMFRGWIVKEDSGNWSQGESFSPYSGNMKIDKGRNGNVILIANWGETAADITISVSGLRDTSDKVIFLVERPLSGNYGPQYRVALSHDKSSVTLKGLILDLYKVTVISWSNKDVVTSIVNEGTASETHENAGGGYEFKFTATPKTSSLKNKEASKINWDY
ncbi:MAG: InlB B-repeat-containing protein [Bacteroidales bacterium]|nr:InlB B-repeat-containing protein [Bacteroidales bacterium]